jgi:exopolysaccharide biosynthesis polyprenyl glycosylphosphotransferase
LILFFRREFFASRFIIIAVWFLSFSFAGLERQVFQQIYKMLAKKGIIRKNIVVVGGNKEAEIIIEEFKKDSSAGINILRAFPRFDLSAEEEIDKMRIDEIIITDPKISREELERILDFSITHHISIKYSADIFASGSAKIEVHAIAGIPFVEIKKTSLEGWGKIFKRAFDILGALFLIIIFSPLLIFATIGILLETGLPVIFKNERVGERGKKFDAFKFRTMKKEVSVGKQFGNQEEAMALEQQLITEKGIKEGPVYKIKDDPRVTGFGRFLRQWSMDELPQFFNCLIGNMSLVGPRPHQPREVEKYARHHQKIFEIKPGITGLAQISGRSNLEFDDEARLDIFYIENWSPKMDLYILLKTPIAIITKKGAY